MAYEHILYQVENGRARITLNRPERRNALCPPLLEELEQALWDADDDKRVHCVIVRGAGPAFCAGYDLTGFGQTRPEDGVPRRGRRTIDDDIWSLERATAASARSGRCTSLRSRRCTATASRAAPTSRWPATW